MNKQLNPDEAVAYGATIQAGIIKGGQEVDGAVDRDCGADEEDRIEIIDVLPITIGVSVIDRDR